MIEDYFESGLSIERYTEGIDELGNPIKIWNPHLDIAGRIDALSGDEQQVAGSPMVVATHMLFCPVVDIVERDRVMYQGKTYEVKFVDNPMNYSRFLQVYVEVQG